MSCSSPIRQNSHDGNDRANKNQSYNPLSSRRMDDISSSNNNNTNVVIRRERPARECTKRAAARLQAAAAAEAEADVAAKERRRKGVVRRDKLAPLKEEAEEDEESDGGEEEEEEEEGEDGLANCSKQQSSRVVTPLVGEPEASQLPRWKLRSMWELASVLNFFNVFRHFLNIKVEFSVEEFETALIRPNSTLASIHIPLLKAIPPITRVALGHDTWVTVMCRKLRDWWHWVAEGELPIVASHGTEVDVYSALDPAVRVVILKALCDIRVEQEDIRNYIDESLKQGAPLSAFRKERIGGDSHGISYWYEDDPIIGHRLYREIRKVEVKKGKGQNVQPIPHSCYQWETVATNFDEFQDVSEKLFASSNRTDVSVGKKLKNNMLPEIEKVYKRKERLLKKQHREALLLDNMMNTNGLTAGRSLRDRKPVTYSFDDYDRSINEAIEVTTKKPSPEHTARRDANGLSRRPPQNPHASIKIRSPMSPEYKDENEDHNETDEPLDRGNRRRQRPQRYSAKEFVEAASDNETEFNSDDDVVGEVVYDDEYATRRKQRRVESVSSEGDEEYTWDEENPEEEDDDDDEEEEEDGDDDSSSSSRDSERRPQRSKRGWVGRTRRGNKLRVADDRRATLRRSKRATRNSINYRQYELSDSDTEPAMEPEKSNSSDEHEHEHAEFSSESAEYEDDNEIQDGEASPEQANAPEVSNSYQEEDAEDEDDGRKQSFLDLNELAPGSGFDDGLTPEMKGNNSPSG
ncbi:unnamed protein product [Cuscuta campestris]|uniref:DDT domain-containing protein n=1 Tax=Cuscuta campestris TaxID=132261 RepID=A0A484NN48_9ASTE|nr:unnamed protein product [Cuscuta campestris]